MNACIRAVVRTALHHGLEVYGIMHGYQGMIEDQFKLLESDDVGNIIQRGGTILKSSRSKDFLTKEGRQKAFENLQKYGIEGIIAIGGDGTFAGAKVFTSEHQIPFIGLPGTIDNDLIGTDYTIGYDTALNNVLDAVDKIKDTAASHDRLFFVEVMGKDAGFIALRSGIGVGAAAILIPEVNTNLEELIANLDALFERKTTQEKPRKLKRTVEKHKYPKRTKENPREPERTKDNLTEHKRTQENSRELRRNQENHGKPMTRCRNP